MVNQYSKVGDLVQFFGLPYIITSVADTSDPYLQYSRHFKAKCFITGRDIGGAITDCINSNCDIGGAIAGRVKSLYV